MRAKMVNESLGNKIYLYVIDLDERGYFRSHVENEKTGKIVYHIDSDEFEEYGNPVEDGFMKYLDDIDGLEKYLKSAGIISQSSILKREN